MPSTQHITQLTLHTTLMQYMVKPSTESWLQFCIRYQYGKVLMLQMTKHASWMAQAYYSWPTEHQHPQWMLWQSTWAKSVLTRPRQTTDLIQRRNVIPLLVKCSATDLIQRRNVIPLLVKCCATDLIQRRNVIPLLVKCSATTLAWQSLQHILLRYTSKMLS